MADVDERPDYVPPVHLWRHRFPSPNEAIAELVFVPVSMAALGIYWLVQGAAGGLISLVISAPFFVQTAIYLPRARQAARAEEQRHLQAGSDDHIRLLLRDAPEAHWDALPPAYAAMASQSAHYKVVAQRDDAPDPDITHWVGRHGGVRLVNPAVRPTKSRQPGALPVFYIVPRDDLKP